MSLGWCLLFVMTPLSYVPEFVTKTVFFSNSLPCSFLVASWSDFAAVLDLSVPSVFLLIRTSSFFLLFLVVFFSVPGMPFSGFVEDCRFLLPTGGVLGTGAARLEVGSVGAHRVWGISTSAAFLVT